MGTGVPSASADDADCAREMWMLPIETVVLPDGWSLGNLWAEAQGGWSGGISATSRGTDSTEYISFGLVCSLDPAATMDADARARALFPDTYRDIGAVEVGDKSVAYRHSEIVEYGEEEILDIGDNSLEWAHGVISGRVGADDDVDWSAVMDFALALDAMLP